MLLAALAFLAAARAELFAVRMPPDSAHLLAGGALAHVRDVGVAGWHVVEAPHADHADLHALRRRALELTPLPELTRHTRDWHRHNDPSLADAWYLTGETRGGLAVAANVGAEDAWAQGVTGRGVGLAVVDDGLDHEHEELRGAYRAATSLSLCGRGDDPRPPTRRFTHGTSAAGVAAAALDNGVCGAGVAPGVRLAGIRLLSCSVRDDTEATAVSHACAAPAAAGRNDVFSMSWGPPDDGRHVEAPGPIMRAAIEHCIRRGRDGRGSVYVVAGGNGARRDDSLAWDGYASSRYTIAVGGVTDAGTAPWYAEAGSALLVSVGTSGGPRGPASEVSTCTYLPGNGRACGLFGGTSAAAPQVAGLVALALEARPDLGWRDVQGVLVHAAEPIDTANAQHPWVRNAAGLSASNQYGFGLVRAGAVLETARRWTLLGPQVSACTSHLDAHHTPIERGRPVQFRLRAEGAPARLEHVELELDMRFDGSLADLARVRLTSPAGTSNLLAGANRQPARQLEATFTSVHFWGEPGDGEWELLLETTGRAPAYLEGVRLCLHGA